MHPVLDRANPFKAVEPVAAPLVVVPEGYVLVKRETLETLYEVLRERRRPAFLAAPSPDYLDMIEERYRK
jgi:hypothetical protein